MGEAEIYKGKKHEDIRALVGGINSLYIVAMLREDYIKKTGNDTLEKALADKNLRIIMKPAGSSVAAGRADDRAVARHQHRRHQARTAG